MSVEWSGTGSVQEVHTYTDFEYTITVHHCSKLQLSYFPGIAAVCKAMASLHVQYNMNISMVMKLVLFRLQHAQHVPSHQANHQSADDQYLQYRASNNVRFAYPHWCLLRYAVCVPTCKSQLLPDQEGYHILWLLLPVLASEQISCHTWTQFSICEIGDRIQTSRRQCVRACWAPVSLSNNGGCPSSC